MVARMAVDFAREEGQSVTRGDGARIDNAQSCPASPRVRPMRSDRIEYRLIFVAAFRVFFVTAVFERALPGHWMSRTGDAPRKSVFEQSREAAKISAAYAFMG